MYINLVYPVYYLVTKMTSPTINAAADKINPIAVTCSSTVCLPKLLFDLCQDQVFEIQ